MVTELGQDRLAGVGQIFALQIVLYTLHARAKVLDLTRFCSIPALLVLRSAHRDPPVREGILTKA